MSEPAAINADEAFVGTVEPEGADKLDEGKLAEWMAANVAGFQGPLHLTKFKGGQSNPTFHVTDGAGTQYVLRKKPPGKLLPSAHQVDREYKVISALGQYTDVPVPKTYALCTDEAVIGTWFYVMECVEGRVLWEPHLPGCAPAERFAVLRNPFAQTR